MENCPKWLDIFIKLVRPGSMVAMFGLLVLGGLIFAAVEFFSPGSGDRAMKVFVGFIGAIDDQYYETLRFMFVAYVVGRSGEKVADKIMDAKVATAVTTNDRPTQ